MPARCARPARRTLNAEASMRVLATACLLACAVAAQAQSVASDAARTIDEGLRRQAERERAQRMAAEPRADSLHAMGALSHPPELPDERPCFVITEIALLGPDATRFKWLTASVAPLLNRCIGVQGLARIAAYLDAQLVAQGFVTSRVSLGPQNLADGRLAFRLDAGRIERIEMVDADRSAHPADRRWGTWRNAFPTHDGALLDARDLEQGVEQMKRLPSQAVETTLAPGSQPDTTVVTIERHVGGWRDRVRGDATLDNSGTPALGRGQLAFSLSLDNPLGLNDELAFTGSTNAEHPASDHRSQSWGADYSIPLGYLTLGANASHSRFAQIVQLPTLPHLSSGESKGEQVNLGVVAWRTAATKTTAHLALSTRRSRSYLDDTELLTQRRKTTFWETGAGFNQVYGNGARLDVALAYRRGVSWLQAEDDLPPDPQDPLSVPTLRPRLWTLDAQVQQLLWGGWRYSGTFRGQHTTDHTLSIDQIAIGGRGSVRGFDGDSVLIAESGWFWRNELQAPLSSVQGASAYAGLDLGRVWGPSDLLLPGRFLAGAALGVRVPVKALQVDLALAAPIVHPRTFQTPACTAYASVTYAF
jgi:hemolysin activation/secretion protein